MSNKTICHLLLSFVLGTLFSGCGAMVQPQNLKHTAKATGVVRDAIGHIEDGRFNLIAVRVEFSDGNGVMHEVVVRDNLNNLKVGMGDRVMVHYNPSSPGFVELSQSE